MHRVTLRVYVCVCLFVCMREREIKKEIKTVVRVVSMSLFVVQKKIY